jgi:hypothetical protein
MDKPIASDVWPELSGPKANTGYSIGRKLNKDAPSLLMAPILVSAGSIEYEFEDITSRRWLIREFFVASTSKTSK